MLISLSRVLVYNGDREKEEGQEFYVSTLDRLTEQQLQPNAPNLNDTVLQFYTDLLAEKKARLAK